MAENNGNTASSPRLTELTTNRIFAAVTTALLIVRAQEHARECVQVAKSVTSVQKPKRKRRGS